MAKQTAMAAIALLLVQGVGEAKAPAVQALTCDSPVRRTDNAATLKARFGTQARVMMVDGAEGEQIRALVLWPGNKARRIEVLFEDDAMRKLSSIRVQEAGSQWRIGGLGVGSSLTQVVAANGRAVSVSGFGWDYGGAVDPKGGKLEHWPGGCRIGLTMDAGAGAPDNVYGDGVMMSSNETRLKKARAHVVQLYISW